MPQPVTTGPEAAQLNLVIEKGATFKRRMRWSYRNADGSKGDPIDLTNYTALMQFRETPKSDGVLLDVTEYVTLGTTDGIIEIEIPDTITASMTWDAAVYDLYLYDDSADPPFATRLLRGGVITSENTSREP